MKTEYFCERCTKFSTEIKYLKDHIVAQDKKIIELKCAHSDSIDALQKKLAEATKVK